MDRNDPFANLTVPAPRPGPPPPSAPPPAVPLPERVPEAASAPPSPAPPLESVSVPTNVPSGERSNDAAVRRSMGRPSLGRKNRVAGYLADDLYRWVTDKEHERRPDGSRFASQSDLLNRLLQIAREAVERGEIVL